jgi:DNA-binding transcriptional ArsR family regulator
LSRSTAGKPPAGGGTPLSPLIHGRVRLLVLSHLVATDRPAVFTELRSLLGLTDGTLSVHLSRLEEGGLITLEKRFVGKRPQTTVALTDRGRREFAGYVQELREIVPGLS